MLLSENIMKMFCEQFKEIGINYKYLLISFNGKIQLAEFNLCLGHKDIGRRKIDMIPNIKEIYLKM